jgi:hypothetical protein
MADVLEVPMSQPEYGTLVGSLCVLYRSIDPVSGYPIGVFTSIDDAQAAADFGVQPLGWRRDSEWQQYSRTLSRVSNHKDDRATWTIQPFVLVVDDTSATIVGGEQMRAVRKYLEDAREGLVTSKVRMLKEYGNG